VPFTGELTSKQWLAELAAGRSYITNGVFLELAVNGKAIGDTVAGTVGDEVRIVGKAIGRNDFRALEVIHNGQVIRTEAARANDGHFASDLSFSLRLEGPGWLALRIPPTAGQNEFGKPLYAHTSPIYFTVNGQGMFHPDVARGLLTEVEASQELIRGKATFANGDEREAVLRVYRDASTALQASIEANGTLAQPGLK
jgi:hypothetical protein